MRQPTIAGLAFAAFVALAVMAAGASAQTSVPGNVGGQLLGEGFFAPASSGGVGSGTVGSPINTGRAATGLFGPGGLWASAKPMTTTASTPAGIELVDAPGTANGTLNATAPVGATTTRPKVSLGGVGPRRFLSP